MKQSIKIQTVEEMNETVQDQTAQIESIKLAKPEEYLETKAYKLKQDPQRQK